MAYTLVSTPLLRFCTVGGALCAQLFKRDRIDFTGDRQSYLLLKFRDC
jgi:hypothetical protein